MAATAADALSVRLGFLWVLAGYAIYMLCQWGMIVALARWGSPEQVGQFALALATTAPIILFANMGLRRVYATDATSMFRFGDYVGLRLVTNVAAMGLVTLVVWTAGYSPRTVWVVLAMGLAKAVEALSDILYGLFQKRGRIDLEARSMILRGPLALAGFAAGFLATHDVVWAVIGMGAGWLAVLFLHDWPKALQFAETSRSDNGSARSWAILARVALPLGLVALLASLKTSIPCLVIAKHMGEGALGLFAALAYFHAASNRIVSALGEAATARLATRHAGGDHEEFMSLVARMLGVALAVGVAGLGIALVAGGPLIGLFYGAPYASASGVLAVIMAAACAANLQTVLDYAMTAARLLRIQPYLYGAGVVALFLLCAALIPSGGLRGAAVALGVASVFEMAASACVLGWVLSRGRMTRSEPALEGP
jgi:O-antigen/teichoic acid export membrane protein